MILGIHHVSISVRDMARMLAFYRDLTGFEVVDQMEWSPGNERIDAMVGLPGSSARMVMLNGGTCYIELFEYLSPVSQANDPDRPVCDAGLTHLCLTVDDIDADVARLTAAGIRFHAPPGPAGAFRAVYGRDPEGNIFELIQFMEDHPFAAARLGAAASRRGTAV
ncbi:VOC family protein [Sphingomonas jatrophae]|uniref:Catechol 2,3-dioxygenase n=1 Tax=Sphingomonas jatrophae TaxID=1166337 RepID=A0A1I6M4F9_9SPHN|nr:VOC family protein [Sphingomonas jatrophae]SFS10570.1 Catechol 2,3-dioxygenase [Sphingomonas jatrophae]